MKNNTIVIEIDRGLANVIKKPEGIKVIIIDKDIHPPAQYIYEDGMLITIDNRRKINDKKNKTNNKKTKK